MFIDLTKVSRRRHIPPEQPEETRIEIPDDQSQGFEEPIISEGG